MILSVSSSSIGHELSKPTSFFGAKLWIAVLICIALLIVFLLSMFIIFCLCRRSHKPTKSQFGTSKPIISKTTSSSMDRRLLSRNGWDNIELSIDSPEQQVVYPAQLSTRLSPTKSNHATEFETKPSDVGPSIQYNLREIETATNGFADENVIGSGDYGVVYRGLLYDHTRVAVKKLICNRYILPLFQINDNF